MQYTKLGNTGVTVSRLCLGCMSYGSKDVPEWGQRREWALGAEQAREHFAAALEAGINFFDTADVYQAGTSEEVTGRWLNEMASPRRYRGCDQGQWRDGRGTQSPRTQPQTYNRGM